MNDQKVNRGTQFQPLPIKISDIILFNLRAKEILKSLSFNTIKLHWMIEVKKILLKSP